MKNLFKSQEALIAEIHEAFDSAQDRLLLQAKEMLIQVPEVSRTEEVAYRLESLGFTQTPTAKKGKELKESREVAKNQIVKTKEEAELINYYKSNYPFLKFLTEDELDRICDKYKLIHAPVGNYLQDVPEKNLREIENAQKLRDMDILEVSYRFGHNHFTTKDDVSKFLSALGKKEPVFTEAELKALCVKYYGRDVSYWTGINSDSFSNTLFFAISESIPGLKVGSYFNTYGVVDKSGLFIAAPPSHFDLKGLEKKSKNGFFNVFKTEVKDPIVFRYCRGGVQVLSKWGLEASDPDLVVEKLN